MTMRVGLDTFTIRELSLDPLRTLDYIKDHGLEGAQFGGLSSLSQTLDAGELREVRAHADRLGLYSHISIPTCNPHLAGTPLANHLSWLHQQIERAAACGWHELHSSLGGGDERYTHAVPWTQHLTDSARLIGELAPVLRAHGSRINLETHGDATTFELVRLVEGVGPDICGICLDTANVFCHAEDPLLAARRAAPWTHLTHTKDAVIFPTEGGIRRQTLPIGQGAIPWEPVLSVLAEYSPDLPLSIEDHKWLFDYPILEPRWIELHPDLTREELAMTLRSAWQCWRRLRAGTLRCPEEYEKVAFLDEVEQRLAASRDHLRRVLADRGLAW